MATPEIFAADSPDVLSIKEAAAALKVSPRTVRRAITSSELPAFIIGGREPRKSGAGLGYRIKREDLHRWYFGDGSLPPAGYVPPGQVKR
jgi:excisionase family DNA binding protein